MNAGILEKIRSCLQSMPIDKAWLFGSYARGEETPSSDIDLLVTYCKDSRPGLFGILELTEKLETIVGKKIDLVEDGTLYPRVAQNVESQKILIYER